MKLIKILIFMGFFSSLFGCKSDNSIKTVVVDGKEVQTIESENPMSSNYGLSDLNENQKNEFDDILKKSEIFISSYSHKNEDVLDSENLDYVLEKWKLDSSSGKKSQDEVVELLGCAFGQDLIDNLNCEWQILTDEYGTDFTVIHKKYKINGFPFSSVLKAIEEDRKESLNGIKLILKKNISDAEQGAEYDKRK